MYASEWVGGDTEAVVRDLGSYNHINMVAEPVRSTGFGDKFEEIDATGKNGLGSECGAPLETRLQKEETGSEVLAREA